MALIRGEAVLLSFFNGTDYQPIGCARSITLNLNKDLLATSSIGSGIWSESIERQRGWSADVEGIASYDVVSGTNALTDFWLAGTLFHLQFMTTDLNGDTYAMEGDAIFQNETINGIVNGMSSFTANFVGTGALVRTIPPSCNLILSNVMVSLQSSTDNGDGTFSNIYEATFIVTGGIADKYLIETGTDGIDFPNTFQTAESTNESIVWVNEADTGDGFFVKITPGCGDNIGGTPGIGTYTPPTCVAVSIPSTSLPNAVVDQPYHAEIVVTGDLPITISDITAPDWMTITIDADTVSFDGTPTEPATDVAVGFTLSNCADDTATFADSIEVASEVSSPARFEGQSTSAEDATSITKDIGVSGMTGVDVTIQLTSRQGSSSITVDGNPMAINDTFSITLDVDGYITFSAVYSLAPTTGTYNAVFTIISVDSGSIGTPNTITITKTI